MKVNKFGVEKMKGELLEVGDKLHISTGWGVNWLVITRVTKTLAFSKRESDGYEHSFKRAIGSNMAHPYRQWNTSTYDVERKAT